jgi:hypothetical protein
MTGRFIRFEGPTQILKNLAARVGPRVLPASIEAGHELKTLTHYLIEEVCHVPFFSNIGSSQDSPEPEVTEEKHVWATAVSGIAGDERPHVSVPDASSRAAECR